MTNIAVIIPYYQKDSGILVRALKSVFEQDFNQTTGPEPKTGQTITVIVIDDASPLPARQELVGLEPPSNVEIELIEQDNGGPGVARNTGLDWVESQDRFDYVAFLDSDDEWKPVHLSCAIETLDQGYDFYFCESSRPGFFENYAEHVPCLRENGLALEGRATLIDPDGPVKGYGPNALDDEFVGHSLCHTTTVVLRQNSIGSKRFDPELRNAGEDWMFWLQIAQSGARIAISWRSNTVAGEGLNIFFKSFSWDAPETLDRIGCQYLFSQKLMRSGLNSDHQRNVAKEISQKYRRAYSFLILRTLMKRRPLNKPILNRVMRNDPFFLPQIPYQAARVILDRDPASREW